MKIFALSDTHQHPFFGSDKEGLLWGNGGKFILEDGDVFIHAGDLMSWGTESEWPSRMENFKRIDEEYNFKQKIYVAGNHDLFVQYYKGAAIHNLREHHVKLLGNRPEYASIELPNGMILASCSWLINLPGWAFNHEEDYIREWLVDLETNLEEKHGTKNIDVMVTHSPPFGINDGLVDVEPWGRVNTHIGVKAYKEFLKRHPEIKWWIHGHVHETAGRCARVGNTRIKNVAMLDHHYEQVSPCSVIHI